MIEQHACVECLEKPVHGRMSAACEVAYWFVDKNALVLLVRAEELGQALLPVIRCLDLGSVCAVRVLLERLLQ